MEGKCIFKFRYGTECNDKVACSSNKGKPRIISIINASKLYDDELHITLQQQLSENEQLSVYYHKNCVSRYTSSSNTAKFMSSSNAGNPPTKKLRSSQGSFDFFTQCMYCGEHCDISKDSKHPDRWRPAYICRSTVSEHDRTPYRKFILDKCTARNDTWANEVRIRVLGAVSDLHAAEARYHKDCMSRFFSNRVRPSDQNYQAKITSHNQDAPDLAWNYLITAMSNDRNRMWNSVELFEEYQAHGGSNLTRAKLVDSLCTYFEGKLVVLSSPGYAKILVFQSHASMMLKMVKQDDDDDIDLSIRKIAKQVIKECAAIPLDRTKYRLDINTQLADEAVSSTMQSLLTAISSKLQNTPPALLIGNIITSVLRNQPTDLQISLGVLLRDSKLILGYTHDFGVTCTYDEVLRFKKSAAVAASRDPSVHGISSSKNGLVQTIVDNYDADIHSPNGKQSTHSLAMILTQPCSPEDDIADDAIVRLPHLAMKLPLADNEVDHQDVYIGQKKPPMPDLPMSKIPENFNVLQRTSVDRARELDFQFLNDMYLTNNCAEYNGYNTKICREQGHAMQPKTKVVYLPLIDKPPAD